MRNITVLFLSILAYYTAMVTVWTVDNNLSSASQFTIIQTATEYSSITIDKALTLIGKGYLSEFGPAVITKANGITPHDH